MHSIKGHISSPSLIYRTRKAFKDIRRKTKLKRFPLSIPHEILLWKSPPQEIIAPRKFLGGYQWIFMWISETELS